jgi:crotonobetainyl-CoA:carnitine CoA-transferase CaiB-like acyl-CoA transferase
VRVIEMGQSIGGPFDGKTLGEFDADVRPGMPIRCGYSSGYLT